MKFSELLEDQCSYLVKVAFMHIYRSLVMNNVVHTVC